MWHWIFKPRSHRIWLLACSTALCCQMGGAIAQTQSSETSSQPQSAVDESVGMVFTSSNSGLETLNSGVLQQQRVVQEEVYQENGIQYVDNCRKGEKAVGHARITDYGQVRVNAYPVRPEVIGRSSTQAWFVSKKTPPAAGLRAVIRNVSQANESRVPYTDREYHQTSYSEGFKVGVGQGHNGRFLVVNPHENNNFTNDFTYEIKRGSQVLESGQFKVKFRQEYKDISRVNVIPRPRVDLPCVDDK
jgi:hypothetical protein